MHDTVFIYLYMFLFSACFRMCLHVDTWLFQQAILKGLLVSDDSNLKILFVFCSAEHIYIPFCYYNFHEAVSCLAEQNRGERASKESVPQGWGDPQPAWGVRYRPRGGRGNQERCPFSGWAVPCGHPRGAGQRDLGRCV